MAKIDRSENLFNEMQRTLAEIAGEDATKDLPKKDAPETVRDPGIIGDPPSDPHGPALFLDLDDVESDPEQPRKTFVASAADGSVDNDLELLRESILQHGVLQPIAVRPLGGGRYRIIAGERRWRASLAARDSGQPCRRKGYDLSRIPAVILHPDTDADRLEMQLVENLARADMTPVDTAKAVKQLMECLDPKPSLAELGKRLGRSKAWVHQMLALGSEEALAVAEYLGVPLESIGQTDISRMRGWMKDEDKRVVLDAIRASLQAGETLSRVLVDREEERYEQQRRNADQEQTMNEASSQPGKAMSVEDYDAPVEAYDENGEKMEGITARDILYGGADSDEDIDDAGFVDENGVCIAGPDTERTAGGDTADGVDIGPQETGEWIEVTLPRSLLERAFAKAGCPIPNVVGPGEVVRILEQVLD
ncbi:ParB/RepB/Spo0J family partition protein [Acidithiobacillus sp.]|uniref:ParB/RepB/Spo0J family partition protein n=1 Tax=Acidithiobacillus sp. TaxID=1872118 RepID=UPI003D02F210